MGKCKNCEWNYNGLCTCSGIKPCDVDSEIVPITPEELVDLVDKITPIIQQSGYLVCVAYNDKDGLAHIVISKEDQK